MSSACGSFPCVVVSLFFLDRLVNWFDVEFECFEPLWVTNAETFFVLVFVVEVALCGRVVSCVVLCKYGCVVKQYALDVLWVGSPGVIVEEFAVYGESSLLCESS